jgi:hypothetical protein
MTVFWDVALCSLVEIDPRFRGVYCIYHQGDPDNEGSKHIWNIGQFLPATRRNIPEESPSYSPPWEPEISLSMCYPPQSNLLTVSQNNLRIPFCAWFLSI